MIVYLIFISLIVKFSSSLKRRRDCRNRILRSPKRQCHATPLLSI